MNVRELYRLSRLEGYLPPLEVLALYKYGKKARDTIIEIGSWSGKSTCCLGCGSRAGNQVPVMAIDHWKGSDEHQEIMEGNDVYSKFKTNIQKFKLCDLVAPLAYDSKEVPLSIIPKPVGLLFIDGSHDYKSVKEDYERFSPLVSSNGVIAFHDVADYAPDVKRFVEEEIIPVLSVVERVNSLVFMTTSTKTSG